METINEINKLATIVEKADVTTSKGRQQVANACKELYMAIEEDVHNAGADWMLKGMYNDLCEGNFAEPFMCEKKKETFVVVRKVYEENILPRL
jgi:hypothetical protein